MPPLLNMIARVGNDLCPLGLRNEWLSPCAASPLPIAGLEICASCATRGTCIRTHLLPTACGEVAITSFGDHPNASITRCIAGCLRFFTLIQSGERAGSVRPIADSWVCEKDGLLPQPRRDGFAQDGCETEEAQGAQGR